MKRKILSLIVSLCLLLGLFPTGAGAAAPEGAGWTEEGNCDMTWLGTDYDSRAQWEILDAADLAAFSLAVNGGKSFAGKTVSLKADIDLSGHSWQPIGKNSNFYFSGAFQGDGHTVSHVSVSGEEIAEAGLFGYCRDAQIRDLRVEDISVSVDASGYAELSAGGIAGVLNGGEISNCIVLGGVFDVKQPYTYGTAYASGVVGKCLGAAEVSHCIAQIDSITAVSKSTAFTGGIAASGTVTDCFFALTGGASPAVTSMAGADPVSQAELKSQAFLEGFNAGWPGLQWSADSLEIFLGGGTGTAANPYLISNLEMLEEFRDRVNGENGFFPADSFAGKFLKIAADIDLSSKYGEGMLSWTPIADFAGTLDGGGHTVNGLFIEALPFATACGLFGTNRGTVKNLAVSGVFEGDSFDGAAGGIAGENRGSIENCKSAMKLTALSGLFVGGIAGQNSGVIEGCENAGAVSGGGFAGGIAGVLNDNNAVVKNCLNTGSISGAGSAGGIIGSSQNGSTRLYCSTGAVTGASSAGGIAGNKEISYSDSPNLVISCYFLQTDAVNSGLEAIGELNGSGAENLFPKGEDAFQQGEVAYLLQAAQDDPSRLAWGQDLISPASREDRPSPTSQESKRVLKVTFATESEPEYAVVYTNPTGTVALPIPPASPAGKSFAGWFSAGGTQFTASTAVTADITLSAQWKNSSSTGGDPGTGESRTGLPYYVQNGEDVFLGFSVGEGDTAKYIAPDGKTILFRENHKSFRDVAENWWGTEPIQFVTEREIFAGTSETTFSPHTPMSRAMFTAVLGRLYERSYGLPEAESAPRFTDADYESYYGKYLDWAAESGIIAGIGGNRFAPDRNITRQEMAAILYRFAQYLDKLPKETGIGLSYPDSDRIAEWAREGALYCQQNGIIAGRDGGIFAPDAAASRAETAAMLERFISAFMK